MNIKFLIALPMAIMALPTASHATVDLPQATVRYGDLNLGSTEGTRQLDRRIKIAANRVCGGPAPSDLTSRRHYRKCVAEALAGTQMQRNQAIAAHMAKASVQLAAR